mmetsp:Transcript_18522/g.27462  ORF Transcript_18522/g.27462 Transcript_18522/m.27462 type:complete len:127 (-) Transcript_18522:826-1206(-)|eukprot:CAMPEP_0194242186 /NCGR_PEP_ID=MMETSP0158-20130606/7799_1 /TAXON_ID=33649 /ORGANISM="Thalassionema nitzschioides, Strain L26-B" /LENGTH=126 /DNA_ID=CAMNT_0038977221 /DNA_START=42 /DNA_END=422 /DNA_ORIENTATION=+
MSSTSARALSGYRRLFRARKIVFKGDHRALQESRLFIRSQFEEHRSETNSQQLEILFSGIDEAEHMMLHEILQGKLNESSGNYAIKVKKEHTNDGVKSPTIEPVTSATVEQATEATPKVEITKTKP